MNLVNPGFRNGNLKCGDILSIKKANTGGQAVQKRYIFPLINLFFKCIYRFYEFLYGKKKYRSARRWEKERKYYAALRKPDSEKYF